MLYFAVFLWISITTGRFTASFLESESSMGFIAQANGESEDGEPDSDSESSSSSKHKFDSTEIGTILAIQRLVSVFVGSITGIWADRMEQSYPNRGRILCLGCGCSLGTLVFCLHGMHRFGVVEALFFQSVHWFVLLRVAFAAFTSLVFPILDGICLDFLKKNKPRRQLQLHPYDALPSATCTDNEDENNSRDNESDDSSSTVTDADATDDYGKERLYGAVSWAITNLCLGPILDHYEGDFWVFYPLSLLSTLFLWITIVVYMRGNSNRRFGNECGSSSNTGSIRKRDSDVVLADDDMVPNNSDAETETFDDEPSNDFIVESSTAIASGESESKTSKLRYYLSMFAVFTATKYTVAFLICVTALASGQAIVNDLIFLFFEFLGSSYTLMSATVVLTVLFEIPIFHVAPRLLKTFGCNGLLFGASLAYVGRVLGYTIVPKDQPAWVLLLEPLHGVTYACSQTASVSFVATKLVFGSRNNNNNSSSDSGDGDNNDNARNDATGERKDSRSSNDGTEATGQGFLQFFVGVGSVLGLEFGGFLQDTLGPRTMYRISALVVMMGCTIFVAVAIPLRKRLWLAVARHQAIPQTEDIDDDDNDDDNDNDDVRRNGVGDVGERGKDTMHDAGAFEMIETK
jgi:MFS family permease